MYNNNCKGKQNKENCMELRTEQMQAELTLLQAGIKEQTVIVNVMSILDNYQFVNKKYELAWTCLKEKAQENEENNHATLDDIIDAVRQGGESLSQEDIHTIVSPCYTSLLSVATRLQRYEVVKRISGEANKVVENILNGATEPSDGLIQMVTTLEDANTSITSNNNTVPFADKFRTIADKALDPTAPVAEVIPSPWTQLNRYLKDGGIGSGQLVTIAARTSVGKTVMATNWAAHAASLGKKVMYISLEVDETDIIKRMVAYSNDIFLSDLSPTKASANDFAKEKIATAFDNISNWDVIVDDEPGLTLDKITAKAYTKKKTDGLDVLFIDYLGLISISGRSKREEMATLSRTFKILARRLGIPIVILAQVNRERRGDEDPMPHLSDIKDAGDIANDSDVALILHRDLHDDSIEKKMTVLLEKNRGGQTGKFMSFPIELAKNQMLDNASEEDLAGFGGEDVPIEVASSGSDVEEPLWTENVEAFDDEDGDIDVFDGAFD